MSNELTIKKVDSPPSVPYTPSTIYFYVDNGKLLVYLTDSSGVLIYRSLATGDIGSLVLGVVNAMKGSANGLASLDSQSRVIQTALTSLKWNQSVVLNLEGDVEGSGSVDGSQNVTINTKKQFSSRHSPSFTYDSGLLSSATFSNGDTTQLTYVQARLTGVSSVYSSLNKIVSKTITYNPDGTIAGIMRTVS